MTPRWPGQAVNHNMITTKRSRTRSRRKKAPPNTAILVRVHKSLTNPTIPTIVTLSATVFLLMVVLFGYLSKFQDYHVDHRIFVAIYIVLLTSLLTIENTLDLLHSPTFRTFITFISVFFFIIAGHYHLIHFYAKRCVPTLLDAMMSAGSPLCQFINYVQFRLAQQYVYFWAAAGATAVSWIVRKVGCWETKHSSTSSKRNRRSLRNKTTGSDDSGPTFEVIDTEEDEEENEEEDEENEEDASNLATASLVDQIARWRHSYPQLEIDSVQLQNQLSQQNEGNGAIDDAIPPLAATESPCFTWSRQNGAENNPPVIFDDSMAGEDDILPEEAFKAS